MLACATRRHARPQHPPLTALSLIASRRPCRARAPAGLWVRAILMRSLHRLHNQQGHARVARPPACSAPASPADGAVLDSAAVAPVVRGRLQASGCQRARLTPSGMP
jgi:hypothetical protein